MQDMCSKEVYSNQEIDFARLASKFGKKLGGLKKKDLFGNSPDDEGSFWVCHGLEQ
jgi:hypothetical protein